MNKYLNTLLKLIELDTSNSDLDHCLFKSAYPHTKKICKGNCYTGCLFAITSDPKLMEESDTLINMLSGLINE